MCIDVVIPTYKPVFEYLEVAINSVLKQGHNYCQLVIVIDQDDNTELENKIHNLEIPRVKTFTQKNAGQSAARNFGIENSEANFVALLDHDDYWLPNHLESLAKVARNSPDSAVYFTGVSYLDFSGNIKPAKPNNEVFEKSLADLLSTNLMVWPSSMLLNKEQLGTKLRFNPIFKGYEDDDLLLRISIAGKKIKPAIEHNHTIIRDHSSRHSYRDGMSQSAAIFQEQYAELADSLHISNKFAKRFFKSNLHLFRQVPNQKNKDKLFDYLKSNKVKGYSPYIKPLKFLSPKLLGKILNTAVRLRNKLI